VDFIVVLLFISNPRNITVLQNNTAVVIPVISLVENLIFQCSSNKIRVRIQRVIIGGFGGGRGFVVIGRRWRTSSSGD